MRIRLWVQVGSSREPTVRQSLIFGALVLKINIHGGKGKGSMADSEVKFNVELASASSKAENLGSMLRSPFSLSPRVHVVKSLSLE